MTLLYFDGFDLHSDPVFTGLDVGAGAMQDAGFYWKAGTITKYVFEPGYSPTGTDLGQGMQVTGSGINYAGGIPLTGKVGRVGFWGKWDSTRQLTLVNFIRTGWGMSFECTSTGLLQIRQNGVLLAASVVPVDTTEWAYYEFYSNANAASYTLYRNNVQWVTAQGTPLVGGSDLTVTLGNQSLDNSPDYIVDHLWVTTGEYPAGTGILGVQVSSALDRYLSSQDGFVGSLVIEGSRYTSVFNKPLVDSQNTSYGHGRNLANVLNFIFTVDPSTGLPWDTGSYATIEKWGLCYEHRAIGDQDPAMMRVVNLTLCTLEHNSGRPLVKNRLVDGAGEFSGPWTKSDPTKSFAWHLSNVPRDNIALVEDTPSVFIDGEGCALFTGPAEPVPGPSFDSVGLTFAEEFREDYKDWVKVDGIGGSFVSYFISGYSVLGEGNRKFQDNYVTVNYENVPTGTAYIQGLWDYSESPDTGRWSMRQIINNKGGDYTHGSARFKIRGHGKALSVKITNHGDHPFVINGWTVLATSNQSP